MLKKSITYENIDGEQVTEDFYFNFTMAELLKEMLISPDDDMEVRLRRIMASNDKAAIIAEFDKYVAASVGYRTADDKFIKTPEYAKQFMSSEAYSELFQEWMTDSGAVAEFINAVMPKKLREQVAEASKNKATVVELPNSGIIEGVAGDAAVQAAKPQPQFATTPGLQTTEAAIRANQQREAEPTAGPQTPSGASSANGEEPAWLREMRQPTRQELIKMGKEEIQLVFKMREAGVLS
jgi:hypothetical protein